MTIFKLPDLGEGLPDAEIVKWHVKEGDVVLLDQDLVSMETAKAVVEVPSPFNGQIVKLYGNPGDIIKTGGALVEYQTEENLEKKGLKEDTASLLKLDNTQNKKPENKNTENKRSEEQRSEDKGTVAGVLASTDIILDENGDVQKDQKREMRVSATPAIRALAQKLKVDLSKIIPTGPNNTITRLDVENNAKVLNEAGPIELLKGTRRAMSLLMSQSHQEIVPVTVVEDAKLFHWHKDLDLTVKLIEAIAQAINKEPALNAWYDSKLLGRRVMKPLNLGLAIDNKDGLFVPVIKNAQNMNEQELRNSIEILKKKVDERSLSPEDLQGATFILSNFGKFAGRYANPIVVPPMVAILGAGRLRKEVVADQNEVKICQVLPLSLTFDHRAVTGGEATRFLNGVLENLENKKSG